MEVPNGEKLMPTVQGLLNIATVGCLINMTATVRLPHPDCVKGKCIEEFYPNM
jgi:hypothetical protein